jgi:hypothetical protein
MRPGPFSRTRQSQITSSDAGVSLLSHPRTILCKLHCDAFTAWDRELQILKTSPDATEICIERVKPLRPARWTQPRNKRDKYREVGISSGNQALTRCAFTGTDRGLLRSVLGPWSPFPNARHLEHPFQLKNTLPWHLGPAKSESSASKIFRHSGITLVFKYHV